MELSLGVYSGVTNLRLGKVRRVGKQGPVGFGPKPNRPRA